MKPKRQKKSRSETSQGMGFMLILLFCVCADGLIDKLSPVVFCAAALTILLVAFWMIARR